MPDPADDTPTSLRRVTGRDADVLARLVGTYDDVQTVLLCCERLLTMMALPAKADPDELGIEALWTLALLCYGRAFTEVDGAAPLSEADLAEPAADGDMVRSHRVLLHLRDHHADPGINPRETYTVGVAQDAAGAVNAVGVTSVRSPAIDADAVRQLGAMTYPLCAVLDERIATAQKPILDDTRSRSKSDLDRLDLIEVGGAG